jgi:hypothetical protein
MTMPVALPDAFNRADGLLIRAASRRRSAIDPITEWLKRAAQRRAERLIAQQICDAGICDFAAAGETWHPRTRAFNERDAEGVGEALAFRPVLTTARRGAGGTP